MQKKEYQHLIDQHYTLLKSIHHSSFLFSNTQKEHENFSKSLLRDSFYHCLAFFVVKDYDVVQETYRHILNLFIQDEEQISYILAKHDTFSYKEKPTLATQTFDHFWQEWGIKQHDVIGSILFMVGCLHVVGKPVLQTDDDIRIMQKLVNLLAKIEYWHDPDIGLWEEDKELHASSVGACVAGLQMIKRIPQIRVPLELIRNGKAMLNKLLPRESQKKFVDLALLSLIYPYRIVTESQKKHILDNVTYLLERKMGIIRYKNDFYHNRNEDGYSEEAEWTLGFSWLAIIYQEMGNMEKAQEYQKKALHTIDDKNQIPQLYYSHSDHPNSQKAYAWSESLFITAIYKLNKKHISASEVMKGLK